MPSPPFPFKVPVLFVPHFFSERLPLSPSAVLLDNLRELSIVFGVPDHCPGRTGSRPFWPRNLLNKNDEPPVILRIRKLSFGCDKCLAQHKTCLGFPRIASTNMFPSIQQSGPGFDLVYWCFLQRGFEDVRVGVDFVTCFSSWFHDVSSTDLQSFRHCVFVPRFSRLRVSAQKYGANSATVDVNAAFQVQMTFDALAKPVSKKREKKKTFGQNNGHLQPTRNP